MAYAAYVPFWARAATPTHWSVKNATASRPV